MRRKEEEKEKKILKGRTLKKGEFEFTLAADDNAPMPAGSSDGSKTAVNDGNGNIDFGEITYENAGRYTYVVTENAGDEKGVSYDTSQKIITVNVTDNGKGTLKADVAGAGKDAAFTNTYKTGNAITEITAKKELSGRSINNGEFKFKLTAEDNAPMPEGAKEGSITVANNGSAVNFGQITYSKEGEYHYTVSEVKENLGGITYDESVKNVTVNVTDNGNGSMSAVITGAGKEVVFSNSYKAAAATAQMTAEKNLKNRTLTDGEFNFTLAAEDNSPMPDGSENGKKTAANNADGLIDFGSITYENPGDYHYTISEEKGSEADVTYDSSVKNVTVTVKDNGDGTMTPEITGAGKDAVFENTYVKPVIVTKPSVSFAAKKALTGKDLKEGEFEFKLSAENNAPMPEGAKDGSITAANDKDGAVNFGNVKYDKAGNYTYTVKEVIPDAANAENGYTADGITYDSSIKTVVVNVTEADGSLKAAVTDGSGNKIENLSKSVSFTNKYTKNAVEKSGSITVKKNWKDSGNSQYRPDAITVELIDKATGETVKKAKLSENSDWSADFNTLEAGKEYTVHEETGSDYYKADNNNQIVAAGENGITFILINTFVHPSVSVHAKKVLKGETLKDGEYSFNLYRNSDPDKIVKTAVNNASGEILFTDIKYDSKGYTVREAEGTDKSIKYDTAAVTYDAEGKITSKDHSEFTNSKKPIIMRVQKRSKEAPYDPLKGSTYGLYQAVPGGNDILVDSQTSDTNGYMYFSSIKVDTVYYFKEIAAPEGHEVDPDAGQKFQLKYTGDGQIGAFDENGKPLKTDGISSHANKQVSYTSSKTALNSKAALKYSDDKITAVAEAPDGTFDAGTTMKVTQRKGSDAKSADAAVEAAFGKIKNTVVYYDVEFFDKNGKKVKPKNGDVKVTIQYKGSLDMPDGTNEEGLKIVHLKDMDGTTDVQTVAGTIASSSDKLLQTSFTSDTFSTFGIVEPADTSALNNNFLITATGVSDKVTKLQVAKFDKNGNYVKGAKLQIIEKSTGDVKAEWNTSDSPKKFSRWFDDEKKVPMNVDTDYILHEVSAPDGYALADDIQFRINKYDSSLSVYTYDDSGNLVLDKEATDSWADGAVLRMVDMPVADKENKAIRQRTISTSGSTIQSNGNGNATSRTSAAKSSNATRAGNTAQSSNTNHAAILHNVKTGDNSPVVLFMAIIAAAGAMIFLIIRKKKKSEK